MSMLILRHVQCGHAIGMANLMGRNLLETKRLGMALAGHSGWEIAEASQEETSEAIAMPWPPCGVCFRHDLRGQPYLYMGGKAGMTSRRKLWATQFRFAGAPLHRHESKAAVYRYVGAEVANWLCGALRSQHLVVLVDERDGRGWQTYEHLDLAEIGGAE